MCGICGKLIFKESELFADSSAPPTYYVALARLIPEQILHKRKAGFDIPLAEWFRTDLGELLRTSLLYDQSVKRCLFHPWFLQKLVLEHLEGKRDWSNRLWAFLFLELWFREFIG